MNKHTVLFIWKSGDRSEDKSITSDFRIETSPMSPVTIKTLVAVKKKLEFYQKSFLNYITTFQKIYRYCAKYVPGFEMQYVSFESRGCC